jgi:hypothetical protein
MTHFHNAISKLQEIQKTRHISVSGFLFLYSTPALSANPGEVCYLEFILRSYR